jgi:Zn-dependent M28 family amino/carboxypeptidase
MRVKAILFDLARMLVPKMVKNGFNSVLQTSAGSRRLVAARNSGTNAKSKTVLKSQKANKNHFRPV